MKKKPILILFFLSTLIFLVLRKLTIG